MTDTQASILRWFAIATVLILLALGAFLGIYKMVSEGFFPYR
jgi:hypothetical protein